MDNLTDQELQEMDKITYSERFDHFAFKAAFTGSSKKGKIQNLTVITKRNFDIPGNSEMLKNAVDEVRFNYKNQLKKLIIPGAIIVIYLVVK